MDSPRISFFLFLVFSGGSERLSVITRNKEAHFDGLWCILPGNYFQVLSVHDHFPPPFFSNNHVSGTTTPGAMQ